MFANRYTAFIDACVLAGALKRNLLLSLAEAEFFRIRWSRNVLEETESAISKILKDRGAHDFVEKARLAREQIERAFEDALVEHFDDFLSASRGIPDEKDHHVLAAALKTHASVIVTDNIKDFPASHLIVLNLEARTSDEFIADTIALDEGRAVEAIRRMRYRFKNPPKEPEELLLDMEAVGLLQVVDALRPYVKSI